MRERESERESERVSARERGPQQQRLTERRGSHCSFFFKKKRPTGHKFHPGTRACRICGAYRDLRSHSGACQREQVIRHITTEVINCFVKRCVSQLDCAFIFDHCYSTCSFFLLSLLSPHTLRTSNSLSCSMQLPTLSAVNSLLPLAQVSWRITTLVQLSTFFYPNLKMVHQEKCSLPHTHLLQHLILFCFHLLSPAPASFMSPLQNVSTQNHTL